MAGTPTAGVALRLAGAFAVARDGVAVDPTTVGSRKARQLLQILAAHRARMLPVDQLAELLWGDQPPRRPADNVATLVSRLRAALGPGAILGGREGYRLGDVQVDLDEASELVREAQRRLGSDEPGFALIAATRALQLLGDGDALVGEAYADWAGPTRDETQRLTREARYAAGEAALGAGDPAAALAVAQAAQRAEPLDETAARLVIRAHLAAGQPALALTSYEQVRARLAEDLGVDPAPATRELYSAVLREAEPRAMPDTEPSSTAAGARSSSRPSVTEARTALVGREAEWARLDAAWSAVAQGASRAVVLVGEAGIGKTRLATELLHRARTIGATVLSARCYDAERSLFLQPFAELVSAHSATLTPAQLRVAVGDRGAALGRLVPGLSTDHRGPAADGTHADLQRRQVFEAVAGFLRAASSRVPAVVFLDDLQNAGLSSVELLHYLARALGRQPVLLLATVRIEEGAAALDLLADVVERIDLGPLTVDAIAALAGEAGQSALAAQIERQTRGHTLFVVETLRGLAAGETGLPASLQAAVQARVRQAGPAVEGMLRAAAVVGASLEPAVLARLLDESPAAIARMCQDALAARLLVVAGREYEFANDLIREVLYATTPEPLRVVQHRRLAELFEDRPEQVAEHAAAAGDCPRAARAFLLAGEAAMRLYSAGDADALLGRALAAAAGAGPASPDAAPNGAGRLGPSAHAELVGRIYVTRGRAREQLTDFGSALDDHRSALAAARAAGDRRLEMAVLRELAGDAPIGLGTPIADCLTHLRRGLDIAEMLGDHVAASSLLGRMAVLAANQLRLSEALDHGRRAVASARAVGDPHALALGLDGLKTAAFFLGDVPLLTTVLAELEPLLRRQDDLLRLQWTLFESATPAYAAGEWDTAAGRMDEAIDVNRRSGYASYESWFVAHRARLELRRGHPQAAVDLGQRAIDLAQSSPHPWWLSTAHTLLAATRLDLGETAVAVALLHRARALTYAGSPARNVLTTALLAESTRSPALAEEATALLAGVTAPPGSAWLSGHDAYLATARAWRTLERPDRAHVVLEPFRDAAARVGWIPGTAEALALAR